MKYKNVKEILCIQDGGAILSPIISFLTVYCKGKPMLGLPGV